MEITELVQIAKRASPDVLGKVPDAAAAALLREVFAQIGQQIQATDEGEVKVAGLGQFRVRQVERDKGGEKKTVKRTIFSLK